MASTPTSIKPAAQSALPQSAKPPGGPRVARPPDKRLQLEDILKLMAADGLVSTADAEHLGRSRTRQYDHPLELIAAQKWKSAKPPHKVITLDALVEWLAGKLKVPYYHIDPLKIDLGAVTQTM